MFQTQTCDPMRARAWFVWRELIDWAIAIGVMVVVFLVLVFVAPVWLAFASALSAAFLVFFFVLDTRVVGIQCSNSKCGKYIEIDTPWKCGFCGTENFDTENFPFIGRCSNPKCKAKPKGYECHHCGQLVFFTKDRQEKGIARCVVVPAKTEPKPVRRDEHAEAMAQKRKSIEEKELSVKDAELEIELRGLQQNLEPQKGVRQRLRERVGSRGELDTEVRKMKAEANAEFKDDPDELKRQHKRIDDEATDLL